MRVSRCALPSLVIVFLFGGYFLRLGFTQPTTQIEFSGKGEQSLECVVQGLKCKGTANFFTQLYADKPGIASIETFATEHLAIFRYDPALISREEIRAIMEAPVTLEDGRQVRPFELLEMK